MRTPFPILAVLCAIGASAPAAGQCAPTGSCACPVTATVGDTPFSTTSGQAAILTTAAGAPASCDVSTFGSNIIHNVTWFRFVVPAAGSYRFETCGLVNFDSRIAVLSECGVPSTCLGGNDDTAGCTLSSSTVSWASSILVPDLAAGTVLSVGVGAFSSTTQGSGTLRIVNLGSPEDGQTCATAFTVAGSDSGTTTSFSNAASVTNLPLPASECDLGATPDNTIYRTVWFRFVASADTVVEVSTCPASAGEPGLDTRLAVFGGCGAGSGDGLVACNDDADDCASFGSAVRFDATAGSAYLIAIGGRSPSAAGPGVLRITTGVAPPPGCGTVSHGCCVASAQSHCSDAACCKLVCAEDPFCCGTDGAWDALCAQRAVLLCSSCGAGGCDLPAFTRVEQEACGTEASNDGCDAEPPAADPIANGDAVAGTLWAQGDARDTDWYSFSLSRAASVAVELHTSAPGMLFLVDDACPPAVIEATPELEASCPASLSLCLPPGAYRIVATTSVFSGLPCDGPSNGYVLSFTASPCDVTLPPNDECSGAAAVPQAGGVVTIDTRLATNSPTSLPASCDEGSGTAIVRDLWFEWTPPEGVARVATCDGDAGADFDTRLAAYAGCGGALVGCNDDAAECSAFRSVMTFPADGSTTYLIRVGGFDSAGQGSVRFDALNPIGNDECASAEPITDGTTSVNTLLATDSSPGLPAPQCDEGFGTNIRKDVWFSYVAPCSGAITAETCIRGGNPSFGAAGGFDTWLAAYEAPAGKGCADALPVACNDDSAGCDSLTSRIQFPSIAGRTYLLRVGGHDDAGNVALTVRCDGAPAPPANDTCDGAIPILAGMANARGFDTTAAATDAPVTPAGGCAGLTFARDLWFEYVPARAGLTTFSLCGTTAFDSRLELWTGCPEDGNSLLLACNDDSCGSQSRITYLMSCTTPRVLVRVGSFSEGAYGPGQLLVLDGTVDCSDSCRADINGDGSIDGADLGALLYAWGAPPGSPADLDGDGTVGGADLGLLISAWPPGGGSCQN